MCEKSVVIKKPGRFAPAAAGRPPPAARRRPPAAGRRSQPPSQAKAITSYATASP
jgi:hypothetical protein